MRYFVLKPFLVPETWIHAQDATLPVSDALGLVLARAATAETDVPACAFARRDGWAVRAEDASESRRAMAGHCRAGETSPTLPPGMAMRINTGAPLPEGANAVIASVNPADTTAYAVDVAVGENVVARGTDWRAGDEVLPAGVRVGVKELALLVEANVSTITAVLKPRVAIIATGTEIQPGFQARCTALTKHSGNAIYLSALMRRTGIDTVTIYTVRDDEVALSTLMTEVARTHDLVITIGGTGRGSCDFTRRAMISAGATLTPQPEREATGKGSPFIVGTLGETALLGLPGNPLAVVMIAQGMLIPVLRQVFKLPEVPCQKVDALITTPIEDGVVGDLCVSLFETEGILQAEPLTKASGHSHIFAAAHGMVKLDGRGLALGNKVTVEVFHN